jgi:hypothetical protein
LGLLIGNGRGFGRVDLIFLGEEEWLFLATKDESHILLQKKEENYRINLRK